MMFMTMLLACMSKTIPPRLEKRIGKDFAEAIVKDTSYEIALKDEDKREPLSTESRTKVQEFLLSSSSYVFGANVRCRLRPDHVLYIQNQGKEYKILFSKTGKCPKLRFISDGQRSVISLKPKRHLFFQSLIP